MNDYSDNDGREPRPTGLDALCLSFSTLGFIGRVGKAPGTAGSLAAVLLAPVLFLHLDLYARLLALATLFVVGGLAASRAEAVLGRKDPSMVVIDEVLGQWLTFLPFFLLPTWQLIAGFVLFRVFDIAKPWPIRRSENWLPGGFGIMLDDVLAGIYAMAALALVRMAM